MMGLFCTLLNNVCAFGFSGKPNLFSEGVFLHCEMFAVNSVGIVLRVCVVHVMIFIKKCCKSVQDQVLWIVKDTHNGNIDNFLQFMTCVFFFESDWIIVNDQRKENITSSIWKNAGHDVFRFFIT